MEDAHITIPNLREDTSSAEKALSVFQAVNDVDSNNIKTISTPQPVISLFGVFDGHGGADANPTIHLSLRCFTYKPILQGKKSLSLQS